MSREDEALAAAANLLRSLAHGPSASNRCSSSSSSSPSSLSAADPLSCKLPGPPSPSKETFEAELSSLALHIQFLESGVDAVDRTLPDTPSELQVTSPLLEKDAEPHTAPISSSRQASSAAPTRHHSLSLRSTRVSNLLAAREGQSGLQEAVRNVSEADISYLRDHVSRQADEIKSLKETIAEISQGLQDPTSNPREPFRRWKKRISKSSREN